MEFQILKRFYSNVEANIYLLKLKEEGINCFLSDENISTILPLSDGGASLNVAEDQIPIAIGIMEKISNENKLSSDDEDFRDATMDDILYKKKINDHEEWLDSGWVNMESITAIFVVLFFIVIVFIVINYFFPFAG